MSPKSDMVFRVSFPRNAKESATLPTTLCGRAYLVYWVTGLFWPLYLTALIRILLLQSDEHDFKAPGTLILEDLYSKMLFFIFIIATTLAITLTYYGAYYIYKVSLHSHLPIPRYIQVNHRYSPEAMRPGSTLIPTPCPSFQARVYGLSDDTWVQMGQCFRIDNHIMTAHHVIEPFTELRLEAKNGSLEILASRFEVLRSDCCQALLSEDELAALGLAKAKLQTAPLSQHSTGCYVKCAGFNDGSIGFLKPDAAFGFSNYSGSTLPGYSGAPLYAGTTVYAMHLGGGSDNLGYDAAYLDMLRAARNESSEDYLMSLIDRYEKFDWQQSPYDPSEVIVRVGNRYYLTDVDVLAKVTGKTTYDPEGCQAYSWNEMQLEPEVEEIEPTPLEPETIELPEPAQVEKPAPPQEPTTSHVDPLEDRLARIEAALALLSKNSERPKEPTSPPPATIVDQKPATPLETTSFQKTFQQSMDGLKKESVQQRRVLTDMLDCLKRPVVVQMPHYQPERRTYQQKRRNYFPTGKSTSQPTKPSTSTSASSSPKPLME